jgi:hypothetical protein
VTSSPRSLWPSLAAVAALALPSAAAADLFSPGELSQAHAQLEGLSKCTSCHLAGEQLSAAACLDCHQELKPEIAAKKGLHGRIPEDQRACNTCHREHQGRSFALVDWGAGRPRFDHLRTGTKLEGKHARLACDACHDPRLIADPAVQAMLKEKPKKKTLLGLSTRCDRCHFDEHRGQLDRDCTRCHDPSSFKPARFAHEKVWALEGKHARVACEKCHGREADPALAAGTFPAPARADFARYKPVTHAACTDCHKDPHDHRFGATCTRCHTPEGWLLLRELGKERAFHDKARFPLKGAHVSVTCQACHGPSPGRPARFKAMAFQACTDCHADAHLGQLVSDPRGPACDGCHSVETFAQPRFGLPQHQKTRFPLEGGHRAVACALCHKVDPALQAKAPQAAAQKPLAGKRTPRFVLTRFQIQGALDRCETCHVDPHAGQFAARVEGCASCHDVKSFATVRFDHQKDSRFKLEGKHAQAACASCHPKVASKRGESVRYKGLALTCAGCHPDPHAGQLAARRGEATDCARCHTTDGYPKTRFTHTPPFTDFRLEGKHEKLACEKCHPSVALAAQVQARRYKPLPRTCEGCHKDFHNGAFQGFEP